MPSLRPGTGIVLLDDEHHTDEDGDAEGARVPADAAAVHASVGLLSRTDAGSGVLIREYVCVLVAPLPLIILLFLFFQRKTHRQSCAREPTQPRRFGAWTARLGSSATQNGA